MGSSPSPPKAPDPKETAAAQAGMNIDTAQAQQLTNMYNQITPEGSLSWSPTGEKYSFVNSEGKKVEIPQYLATQQLSPAQQAIYDKTQQIQGNIAQIGVDQSARIGDLLGTPVSLGNEEVEKRLFDLGSARLNPEFAKRDESLRQRLANQGIKEGSAAWNSEMERFTQSQNDAFNQLLLAGRGQAVQEELTQRNQPINEITALLSGSQVSQPNFVGTPSTTVQPTDYIGAVRDKQNYDLAVWQQQVQSKNSMMGGLFGLAGSALGMFSDKRLKEDIQRVGKLNDGTPVYAYKYKFGGPKHIGVMAQDVEKKNPEAVGEVGGFKTVDYGQVAEAQ